ncbi:MAG TPA: Sua5 family C-terminal domain-containing protein, partial [Caulifigura sp.]|nr:Sua5 family C-terminal domain-containing protein [Caulifigura sp.]
VQVITSSRDGEAAPGPGMLERHYSPRTPLRVWLPGQALPAGKVGLLSWRITHPDHRFETRVDLSPNGNLVEAASRLFAAMRELDSAGLDAICATPFPEEGLGRAINDRLRRAAAGH